jgi:hypothetical protein
MDYQKLRKQYPTFSYTNFSYSVNGSDLVVKFSFEVGDHQFNPIIRFKDIDTGRFELLDKNVLGNLIFHLGLAEIPSYWKAFASPGIEISAGRLDEDQLNWWKDLLLNGMGQYFYENNIDFTGDGFVTYISTLSQEYKKGKNIEGRGLLIPVGGGKDSAVTLELLKSQKDSSAFMVNPSPAALSITEASGIGKKIIVKRTMDKKIKELNSLGYLNGHTPFSSVIAFLSVAASYIYGFDQIALSNERSSDEENTEFLGSKINHQYSKTFEFENKFRSYVEKYLININYFSFLRPLYEIQIAKLFSGMRKYFAMFRSCNIGHKTNSWCGNCSKCLSTYILLMPFLKKEELIEIFGEDLPAKPTLQETLKDLTIEGRVKPFECVGTKKELSDAVAGDLSLLKSWNGNNNLPEKYEEILKRKI